MTYYAAGEYMARKRVETARARADLYWATPRPRQSMTVPRFMRSAVGSVARAFRGVAEAPGPRVRGLVVSRGWSASLAGRRGG